MDWDTLLKAAEADPDVIGLILVGSRGKGFENEFSDYDAVMIVADGSPEAAKQRYADRNDIDLSVYTLADFEKYAGWESPESWDRYNYAHTKIVIDRTNGKLQEVIDAKGHIPQDKRATFVDYWIDAYVNGVFRSVKCIRSNNVFGARLAAANSMLDLLTLLFAINGRHRPFLHCVQNELEAFPLEQCPWSPQELVEKVLRVLDSADLKTQQELLVGVEKLCRELGHGHMFDAWEGKDKWAMTFGDV